MPRTSVSPSLVGASNRDHFRRVFSAFPTGVTVVTVGGPVPHGMTASSFTSVSLDPPMLLICIDRSAKMYRRIFDAPHFAVSVLGERDAGIAKHFASSGRPDGIEQFQVGQWRLGVQSGAPILDYAEAAFECRRHTSYECGDHLIVIGEVEATRRSEGRDPLVFVNGLLTGLPQEV